MAFEKLRAKEANAQITRSGVRLGGSMLQIIDLRIEPKATIDTTQIAGEARERGDLNIKGVNFSFRTYVSDAAWLQLWNEIQAAEAAGKPLPEISFTISFAHRTGGRTVVGLSGDLVLHLTTAERPESGYLTNSWSGFCSFMTAV